MGQCGCCEFHPDYALPGPEGSFYTLQFDSGCRYCGVFHSGLIVKHVLGEAVVDWNVEGVPSLPLPTYGDGPDMREQRFIMLEAGALATNLAAALEGHDEPLTKDEILDIVQEVLEPSIRESHKLVFEKA